MSNTPRAALRSLLSEEGERSRKIEEQVRKLQQDPAGRAAYDRVRCILSGGLRSMDADAFAGVEHNVRYSCGLPELADHLLEIAERERLLARDADEE